MEASVEAFVEASVEVASVEAPVEVSMKASTEVSTEAFMEASVEAFMEASTAWKRETFHESFYELPPKMQIVQVALSAGKVWSPTRANPLRTLPTVLATKQLELDYERDTLRRRKTSTIVIQHANRQEGTQSLQSTGVPLPIQCW